MLQAAFAVAADKRLDFVAVEECDVADSVDRETHWMDVLSRTYALANCRRATLSPNVGRRLGIETRNRMSEAGIARFKRSPKTLTREESLRMNAAHKPHTPERRQATRELGYASGNPVTDLDSGERWPSARQAAAAIGCHPNSVQAACKGVQATVRGRRLQWELRHSHSLRSLQRAARPTSDS